LNLAPKASPKLANVTIGVKDRVRALMPQRQNLRMEDLHTLSMELNDALSGKLENSDKLFVPSMKRIVDDFLGNVQPTDLVNGTPQNVALLKEADKLYAQKMKLSLLSRVIDNADTNTGQYTQSQVANTIRREAAKLYNAIMDKKVRGFSVEEIKLLRDMKKGTDVGGLTRLLARFAPRGPVSIGGGSALGGGAGAAIGTVLLGPGVGSAIGGAIGGAAVPIMGGIAGNVADKTAIRSLGRLASSAAYGPAALGNMPMQLSAPLERLLLPAGVGASTAIGQRVQ
jgi:hypothetical protein